MATGILGQAALSALTNTTVYTVPASTTSAVSISFSNRSSSLTTIRLAIASAATPSNSEYLEYDTILDGNGVIERTGIVMQAGERVVAYTAGSSVSYP